MPDLDLRRFKALTFDCYGTLIDWETGILTVLRAWARRHDAHPSDDALLTAFAEAEYGCQAENPEAAYPDVLRSVQGRVAARLALPSSSADADALADSVQDWPPFDDAPAALATLNKHYKLVVLSNIDRASFAHSNRLLGVTFDAVITAQDVGGYKPGHGHFLRAFELLAGMGIERHEILHVAQSLFHDHVPAQALGLKTVWVDRRRGRTGWGATPPPPTEVRPDLVVPDLVGLVQLVTQSSRRMNESEP
jgi:2-haloalkanoic acid dehalogenase type II